MRCACLHLSISLCLVAVILPFLSTSVMAEERPKALIESPIDYSARATIPNSTHPLARAEFDQGPVDADLLMERLILVIGIGVSQETKLRTFLDSQQTRASTNYHRWLTPEEFGARFGPDRDALAQIWNWLEHEGFKVNSVGRSGRWIEFSGTAGQIEHSFQTEMRRYQVGGSVHIANASDISVPAVLAPVIRGVSSLSDFFSRPLLTQRYQVHRAADGTFQPMAPDFTFNNGTGPLHYLAPSDYSIIYNLAPLYQGGTNGSGKTIAIVGRSKVEVTDVDTFQQVFNLPANAPHMIVNGTDPGFTGDNDAVEASLDVEWAGAVAPAARIDLVVSQSTTTTDGVDLSSSYIVDQNLADVISVSFGNCESNLGTAENAFLAALWQQAAAQGISVFVAAGDTGAAGCDFQNETTPAQNGLAVNGLASTPFNTAVGGTMFAENGNDSVFWNSANGQGFGSAIGYIPEAVWNESCDPTVAPSPCSLFGTDFVLVAGGGGLSSLYSKPSWQNGAGVPNDGHRDVPDVSLTAAAGHDGYLFCFEGSCQTTTGSNGSPVLLSAAVVGGTSASTPPFAGLLALIDQMANGRQGLANYELYKIASAENSSVCDSSKQTDPSIRASGCTFNDITSGNNSVPGLTGYSATSGFDLASGWGSVNASNLANAWNSAVAGFQGSTTTLTAVLNGSPVTSISIQHGQAVSVAVQVQPIAGSGQPTGSIALITDRFGAIGAGALTTGSFSGSFNSLPGGAYNLSANYPGDGTFGGSQSAAIPVTITSENSTIELSGPATAPYGSLLAVQAMVASASGHGVATGEVTFADAGTQVATVPLNNSGDASLPLCGTTSCLTVGSHSITASYAGDSSLNASTVAQPVALTITKGIPSVFLELIQTGANQGQQWEISGQLFNTGTVLPTGTLQFFDNGNSLGQPLPISSIGGSLPQATVQVNLAVGAHSVSANYSGDTVYTSATSGPVAITVDAPFQFSTANPIATVVAGQTASYSLLLTSNNGFSGTVAVACAGAPVGANCSISPSTANLASFASVLVTVTVSTSSQAKLVSPFDALGGFFAVMLSCGVLAGFFGKQRTARVLLMSLIVFAIACGNGGSRSSGTSSPVGPTGGTSPQSVAIVVTGTSGTTSESIVLALQINQ